MKIIRKIRTKFNTTIVGKHAISELKKEVDCLKINNGKLLGEFNFLFKKEEILKDIKKAEFKVFSQCGDDGIIHFLCSYLDIPEKIFVEFGVENYTECNTRFLLVNDNWRGVVMDGSVSNIASVRNEELYWLYDLTAIPVFITAENINQLLLDNKCEGEIGLLHIDIDGNDYWVWKAIKVIEPVIVIVEYNSLFGFENPFTIPYNDKFIRIESHYSNMYFGTSILSLVDLAQTKGYSFIGCNSSGNNAYFVKNDKLKDLTPKSPKEGYVESKFADTRDKTGQLSYVRGHGRHALIDGCEVYNTRTNKQEILNFRNTL